MQWEADRFGVKYKTFCRMNLSRRGDGADADGPVGAGHMMQQLVHYCGNSLGTFDGFLAVKF